MREMRMQLTRAIWSGALLLGIVTTVGFAVVHAQPDKRSLSLALGDSSETVVRGAVTQGAPTDGQFPDEIDRNAASYTVLLEKDTTMGSFEGSARVAGQAAPTVAAGPVTTLETVSEAAMGAAGDASASEGATEWVEMSTAAAALYFFSAENGSGPNWERRPPAMFMRRTIEGRILVWLGRPGTSPPDM